MQQELTGYFHDPGVGPGLLLAQAPTGYGKTYQAVQAIYAYLRQGGTSRVLFVTTLLKNLPVEDLRHAYEEDDRGDEFDREVLVLRSAADTVVEALERQEVPEEFQTEAFRALKNACRKYRAYQAQPGDAAAELARALYDSIRTELEPAFRHELEASLRKAFPRGPAQRRDAIRKQKRYGWIGEFYPAVFWADYKVLFLSVKKLMARNVTIVEPSFECLSDAMLRGAVLCLDEFDASRETVLASLIDKALELRADYLQLFLQVYKGIHIHKASRELTDLRGRFEKGRTLTWNDLLAQAESIYQDGALQYSMKTVEVEQGKGRNFLFHDTSYLTVLDGKRTHIRAVRSDEQDQVQIHFETREKYNAHKNDEQRIVLQRILRRIHVFLLRFQRYVYGWAEEFARQVNAGRGAAEDLFPAAAAAESIFREYGLSAEQIRLMAAGLETGGGTARGLAAPDLSFYETGFRLFEFIDDDRHRTQTMLQYFQLQNTPEKVLLYICRRAKVVGLSATADLPTVLGNYDLRYLREQMGGQMRTLSPATREKIKNEMEAIWKPYRTGEVQVRLQVVDRQDLSARERLEAVFGPGPAAVRYENCFSARGIKDYDAKRYCNLFTAMKAFWQHGEIQAFLCLNQVLPARGKAAMDEDILRGALEELRRLFAPEAEGQLVVLRSGDRFEKDKTALLQCLGAGERRMIFSSYQTLGAGQNLQYPVQDHDGLVVLGGSADPADPRLHFKDVDALYLGDVTHVSVNLQEADSWKGSDLMRYCFQAECLYQNDEISYQTLQQLLKNGIGRSSGKQQGDARAQALVRQCDSFSGRVTRDVMQAVGRMGRTFLKRPCVYLLTTMQVLTNLNADCLGDRLLAPEMQALVQARSELQAKGRQTDRAHLEAERIATRGNAYLMRMLNAAWTDESMALWKELRQTVLRTPRAAEELRRQDPVIRTYYLPMAPAESRYFYAQKGDFSEVRLAPGNDKAALAASLPQGVFVSEVSEEEARLAILLSYPGMRAHFEAEGWATGFGSAPYILSPVLFQNIYKGALGEVAGAYILKKELGLSLREVEDPACFEFFDFAGPEGSWFDFKHWKSNTCKDEEEVRRKTLAKLDAVGGRRAFLVNLIAEPAFAPRSTADGRLVEIPGLLLPDGTVNRQTIQYLGRCLQ